MSKSYLTEAFKSLAMLNEEDFELNDDGVEEMQSVLSIHDDPIEIIDTEAETVADLEETHIGDAILDCVVCHSKLYKNPKDIIIDDAGEGSVVNYGEECPYCYSTDGFKLIGQIAPFEFEQETEVKVDDEVVDSDDEVIDDEEEKEVEVDVEEKEEVDESVKSTKISESAKEKFNKNLKEALKTNSGKTPLKEGYADVFQDLIDRAESWIKDGYDKDEAIRVAIDDGLTYSSDIYDIAYHYGVVDDSELLSNCYEMLFDDLYREVEEPEKEEEVAESLTEGLLTYREGWAEEGAEEFAKEFNLGCKKLGFNKLGEVEYEFSGKWDDFNKARDAGYFMSMDLDEACKTEEAHEVEEACKNEDCKTLGSAAKREEACNESCDDCNEDPLTEKNWTATIVAGSDLRKAIEAGDYQAVLDGIEACYKEMLDKGIIDEDDFNDWIEDFHYIDVDDEDVEDEIDYALDNLYDACDNLGCWLALDEKLSEDIKHTETLVDDEGTEVVVDGKTPQEAEQKAKQLNQKLGNKMKTVAKNKVVDGKIQEEFEKVDIDTGDEIIHVSSEDKEEQEQETSEEVIVPPTPELEAEVENNTEEAEEDKEDNSTVDVDFGEFDEETFDTFGESYLKKVYNNVESYETTEVKAKGNELVVEGVISFKSGKQKKTSFIFEAKDMTKNGNVRFVGRNESICNSKKAFTLTGKFDGGKFLAESFNYNYRAKDTNGKTTRLYGTFKK